MALGDCTIPTEQIACCAVISWASCVRVVLTADSVVGQGNRTPWAFRGVWALARERGAGLQVQPRTCVYSRCWWSPMWDHTSAQVKSRYGWTCSGVLTCESGHDLSERKLTAKKLRMPSKDLAFQTSEQHICVHAC